MGRKRRREHHVYIDGFCGNGANPGTKEKPLLSFDGIPVQPCTSVTTRYRGHFLDDGRVVMCGTRFRGTTVGVLAHPCNIYKK